MSLRYLTCMISVLLSVGMNGQSAPPQLLMPFGITDLYNEYLPLDFDANGELDFMMDNGVIYLNPNTSNSDWLLTSATGPLEQYARDFNGDQYPDVLCDMNTTNTGAFAQLMLAVNNNGTGFSLQPLGVDIPVNSYSDFLNVADIDFDGDSDIAVDTTVLINDGAGNFTTINVDGSYHINKMADIDGDGLRDLIVSLNPNEMTWYLIDQFWRKNLGGSFGAPQPIELGIGYQTDERMSTMGFFDFDNDGDEDFVGSSQTNNGPSTLDHDRSVGINDGNGSFTRVAGIADMPSSFLFEGNYFTFDYDSDGDQDVVSTVGLVVINNQDGTVSYSYESEIIPHLYTNSRLHFYSLNGLGYSGAAFGYHVFAYNHDLLPMQYVSSFWPPSPKMNVFPADMDNDGITDLAVGSMDINSVNTMFRLKGVNSSKLVLNSPVICNAEEIMYSNTMSIFGFADWNNDGVDEFTTASTQPLSFSFDFDQVDPFAPSGNSFPSFFGEQDFHSFLPSIMPYDINGDGWMDFAFPYPDQAAGIYMNDNGTFVELSNYTTVNSISFNFPSSPGSTILDVNGDGLMDTWSPYYGYALIQNPDFTFDEISCPVYPFQDYNDSGVNPGLGMYWDAFTFSDNPDVFDFNNDGFDDVLSNGIVFRNDGGTQFIREFLSPSGNGPATIWDADGDSDLDLVTWNIVFNSIMVFENLGNGVFAEGQTALTNAKIFNVQHVDWDNNGSMDLVFSGIIDDVYGVYFWDGITATEPLSHVTGNVFVDDNANGVRDSGEIAYAALGVSTSPFAGMAYTNANGDYALTIPASTYDVHLGYYGNALTSTNPVQSVTIASGQSTVVDFPLVTTNVGSHFNITINKTGGLCSGFANVYMNLLNDGTTTPDADVTLSFPSMFTFVSANMPVISQTSTSVTFSLVDMARYQNISIQVILQNPDASFLGTPYTLAMTFDATDDVTVPNLSSTYSNIVTCAFDPNAISELTGYTDSLYVNGVDDLEYVILFQNTGNVPATDILIEDELPQNLDWTTMQPIAWSHGLPEVIIDETGKAIFTFQNINLPDSVSDEAGSHGFVKYRIKPVVGLQHGDTIENSASIFFDQNEGVITNTVVNHIFDCNTFNAQFEATDGVDCFQQHAEMIYNPEWAEEVLWIVDGIVTSNENQIVFTDITNDFSLTLQASNPLCGTVTQEATISSQEIVQPQIATTATEFCDGGEAILTSSFDANNEWYLNNNLLSTNNSINISTSGDYVLMVHNGDCVSDAVAQTIVVNALPASPEINVMGVVLNTPEVSGLTYQWYLNGEAINGATSANYTALESGIYSVNISDENGCYATSATQNVVIGVNEILQSEISVYPNPANNVARISFNNASKKVISIIAPDGRLIDRVTTIGNTYELNVSNLEAGHYYLSIISFDKIENKILVVE